MRCIEGIEQTAKALNDSGVNASNITLNAAYNGSVYDVVGTTYKNAAERVAQGALDYSQTITTAGHTIPIPIPGYMNTFKEPDRYGEETRNTQDEQGRRQNRDTPPRRRSGESVDETQLTNTNN